MEEMSVTESRPGRKAAHLTHSAHGPSVSEPVPPNWAVRRRRWVLPVIVLAAAILLPIGVKMLLSNSAETSNELVFFRVKRGTLPITVTERGNLESQQTEQIICEVENFGGDRSGMTGTQILFIVPNGSSVKKGDLLVELDAAPLKERLDSQFLSLQRAEAEMIQAKSKYDNQETQNDTNLAEAELKVKLAELDMESYEDETGGTFQIELQNIEMEIQTARAQQMIRKSDRDAFEQLYKLGYKSKGDVAAARLELLKSDSNLASQMARARQLQKYTYEMEKLDRKGRYDTAVRSLTQVKRNNESELAQAEAARDSANRAHEKENERYERYTLQLEKCKIYAPQDGMVAYAMGDGRSNRGSAIEEGAFVRERQEILTLPNLSSMQVNTAVHESVLDQVRPGLKAVVRVDAFADRSYQGTVKSVAVLPDQGGWLASDTKVYKTIVTVDEEVAQLKPGMTAVVEIDIEQLKNIVSVPIQAIVQRGSENWCYVKTPGDVEKRPVTLGKTNDKFVEIKQGLTDNDMVVLNPTSLVDEENEAQRKKEKESPAEGEGDEPGVGEPVGDGVSPAAADETQPAAAGNREPGAAQPGQAGPGKRPPGAASAGQGGAEATGPQGADGGGPKPRGGGGRGGFALANFDQNGDGKVTKEELPEGMQSRFNDLDKNSDGAITTDELPSPRGNQKKQESSQP